MAENFSQGISIDKLHIKKSDFKTTPRREEATQSHRDEGHTFHILENGSVVIEIDFQKYKITAPAVVYMHPNQVHRIVDFTNITVCSLSIKNENLNQEYLKFLEEIAPSTPSTLTNDISTIIFETFSLCLKFSTQKSNRLNHLLLKDSCNTLVGLLISVFLNQNMCLNSLSRFEIIAKSFNQLLEKNYCVLKRPAAYAKQLNISTHYLNESIKNITGLSISQCIRERIILEAKRLLYHSDKSVKEIAFELGYDDYPYFSRLFTKTVGMSALAFRNKRHD
ncbi:helix-turn-helix transcriptional regulator [Chryseobacterium sp. ISL-6]|uniref:helix-turn-helix domain-containing protein n=1 Tax=Chryseobacterium sp. ISL-6 TaxID=2819143 RepID=UPI001BE703EC|nr:helix-turn-helix transcriptional regulator [Chryseobacterium sp. ISL-6]MBT2623659.1 helix-turn-helix domain-containing protein [Chryseobacterium sp. ISL-6]